ncbi:succinyl-diaminopimelate desuccinylase [Rugosibacter aromaticivorans]|uniref:Succinyl-diaminopimelate desuccinylase n=1 Tax=Rugosibacter aromaticivorans TaxID=1565605 RepID=A0A0C5JA69_9PROT|nr:succinyl-diaminopimelate desuccinylase [Rugosibacter aromaticivorans]AJP48623.1 succinyl-diaminopimelate desuccinylase [Rugosibacter aromaticivorans]TAJ20392.1 MAG: succinyl-diaminopimelate desuccinylase [Rugosibacter sp.]TBR15835.1 MAG: succinyl-diaminopimelate desuccinylase [Rugosibacter sp.]
MQVLEKVQALIARASITPEDGGCLDLIASWLMPLGFSIERMDQGGVSNLWAKRRGSNPQGKIICFAGHTDVVPTGPLEKWTSPPFTPEIRDSYLYGRGAADMKSSLAACVVAIERLLARRAASADSLALLLTSDEEGDAINGTVRVVEALKARGEAIDYCIVGEPTCVDQLGDTVKNGRRGSLSAKLIVKGVQGHVAYPHLVKNPVHLAAPVLAELVAATWDDGNEDFPPTSLQISNAHAGTGAGNVSPGTFELLFNFRFSTASTAEGLQARVHDILDRHGLAYDIHWTLGAKPFLTPRGQLCLALSESITRVTGITPVLATTGGTSDGRFIADICSQVVEFGPTNDSIHKIDERIAIAELEYLAQIYEGTFDRLLT